MVKRKKACDWMHFKGKAVYIRWFTDKAELSGVGVIKEVIFLGYNLDGYEIWLLILENDTITGILSTQVTWMECE